MSTKDTILNIVKKGVRLVYRIMYYIVPIKENVILFESSNGRNYTGNPKYIYEKIVEKGYDTKIKCVWSFENPNTEIPGNAIKVRRSRFKFLYYTLRSSYWIFDSRHIYYLLKNDKTKYIQTWHGTPLKKLALDMDKVNMGGHQDIEDYKTKFKENSHKWDYLISQNTYSSKIFKRAFDFKGKMLEIGYPRNDILINKNTEKEINKIKEKLNIPSDKKIILYAPTWRDDKFNAKGIYKFASDMDYDLMKNQLNDDYIMIVKYHYLVKDQINWDKYGKFIIECDEKWDIQELYLISDLLITDYSSVMFDYAILNRPILFYTYDLKHYRENLRDFYFDMEEEVPGPIVETTEDLIKAIKEINLDREDKCSNNPKYSSNNYNKHYSNKYKQFQTKYNEFDKGTACDEILKLIIGE